MFISIINDCQSNNDKGRQETRLISLFGSPVSFVGVSSDFSVNATLEAAGNLIDMLDAAEDREGVVLVNVAPRGDVKQDGHNGTPFCYFNYKNTLVISTVKGHTLSLVKKLGLVDEIQLVDVEEVMDFAFENKLISAQIRDYAGITQFRSYDFVPRLAYWLKQGEKIPAQSSDLSIIPDVDPCIWLIDAFGNAKTTITNAEIDIEPGSQIATNMGEFKYYRRLKDLPTGETAFYTGSSGIDTRRFVEIAVQKTAGSAAKALGLKLGDEVVIE